MIPKVIHYVWFGGAEKPDIIKKCIESWKKFCPDYEIIEWNESNYDVKKSPYIASAIEKKMWAFASDYARMDIVYEHGGIYLDTDVELFKTLDEFLTDNAFFVFETGRIVASGLAFGAVKGHEILEHRLQYYENRVIGEKEKVNSIADTELLVSRGLKLNGESQKLNDIRIVSCLEYAQAMKHYGTKLWSEGAQVSEYHVNRVYKSSKWKNYLRNPKKFEFVEKHFGKKGLSAYTFFAYDLQEHGLCYYIKRLFKRKK